MPTNLTDASSWDPQTAPVGGDIRNAASMASALQTSANRARFVKDRLEPLADLAALQAIASPADGLVRLVKDFGLYVFDAGGSGDLHPFVVEPTVGTGTWYHALYAAAGAANGLATLDASSKVEQPVPNRIVGVATAAITANVSRNSTTFGDAAGLSVAVSAQVGDILVIDATLLMRNTSGTGLSIARVLVDDGGTPVHLGPTAFTRNNGERHDSTISGRYVVTNAGTVTVKVQHAAGTSTATEIIGGTPTNSTNVAMAAEQSAIRVLHIRP